MLQSLDPEREDRIMEWVMTIWCVFLGIRDPLTIEIATGVFAGGLILLLIRTLANWAWRIREGQWLR